MSAVLRLVGPVDPDEPAGRRPGHAGVPGALLPGAVVVLPADGLGESSAAGWPSAHDLDEHEAAFGRRPAATAGHGDRLLATIEALGLTGRGGGHFPVAAKWRAVRAAGGGGTVVANGAEGEPASAKDAVLLRLRPHLVLDGLAAAAEAVAAREAVVWLHAGADAARLAVARAVAERRAAGLPDPPVRIAVGPDHYLSGESSAVVRALSGGPALPRFTRVSAATSGIDGEPTLVQNVESLARVAVAGRTTVEDYRPTVLLTVVASGRRTVVEVDHGTPVHAAVTAAATAGAPAAGRPTAVLLGGYGGTWLPWDDAADLPLDERAARASGWSTGAGVVAPLPAGTCGLAETAAVVDYLAGSSARQCGPCVFGLRSVADTMALLASGAAARSDLRLLHRWTGEIRGRGACHHPDGAVRLVATALATFSDDVHSHVRRGRCLVAGGPPLLPFPGRGVR